MPASHSSQTYSNDGAMGCLARLYWMFLGNGVLLFSAASIGMSKSESFLSTPDIVFGAGVVLLVILRFLDIRYLKGARPDGQPASMLDFWQYVRNVSIATGTIWSLAHLIKYVLA